MQSLHIVENAHNVARYVLESFTQESTWLENKMVKILANQSYFDLDAWQTIHQILLSQNLIQKNCLKLQECMFQLGVCKRDERFTWDKFKKNEEDHKNMKKAFTNWCTTIQRHFLRFYIKRSTFWECNPNQLI